MKEKELQKMSIAYMPQEEKRSPMLETIGDLTIRKRVQSAQEWLNTQYSQLGSWPKVKAHLRSRYSESAFSGFASGSYPGNALTLTEEIENARLILEEAGRGFRPVFVETSVARSIFKAVRLTRSRGELGLLSTESGIGKTTALRYLLSEEKRKADDKRQPGSAYAYLCANPTMKKTLFPALAALIRVIAPTTRVAPSPAVCYETLRSSLYGQRRFLIMDEAQCLGHQALDTFRTLAEETETPILFSGNPEVFEFGFLDRSKPSAFAQFASRCLVTEHIRCSDISKRDVELVAGQLLPDVVLDETVDDLLKTARLKGGFRRLKGVLARASEMAKGKAPNVDQVNLALQAVLQVRGDV